MQTTHVTGVIFIVISATVFSTAGLFVKGVESDSWTILFWRGLSAAIFTVIYIAWRGTLQREFMGMGKPGMMAAIVGALATIAFKIGRAHV
jgi:hypothetical protein